MQHYIRLSGAIEITLAGGAAGASLYRPRKLALLSLLLLNQRPMRRQELASLLWPDVDDRRARGSLNQLLLEMRRDFGSDAFESRSDDELTLRDGAFVCDAMHLMAQSSAGRHDEVVSTYNGALMPGLTLAASDAFNDWADSARRRFDDVVADSAWKLAQQTADRSIAVNALALASDLRPFDEAILRHRMRHAASAGNVAQAAALFETHRARIAEEIGITPAPETRRLLLELCASNDSAGSDAVALRIHSTALNATSVTRVRRTTLLQRAAFGVACAAIVVLMLISRSADTRDVANNATINVALMSLGDERQPVIRALPGLVGTYLIRDTSVELSYGPDDDATYQVVADLSTDADQLMGTVQIRKGDALISSTAVRTSTRVGMDSVAAQIARFVSDAIAPVETHSSPKAALNAAQRHLQFARADYARGARDNAFTELARAESQLDSIAGRERKAQWQEVREAVVRERAILLDELQP